MSFSTTIPESSSPGAASDATTLAAAAAAGPRTSAPAARLFAPEFRTRVPLPTERTTIPLTFDLQPSLASERGEAPTGRLVAMLAIDAPTSTTPPPPLAPGEALPAAGTSFERFAETVFRWVAAAFGGTAARDEPLSRTRVAAAYDYLTATATPRPLAYERDIVPGLFAWLRFTIEAVAMRPDQVPFPMIPELTLTAGEISRTFAASTPVDDTYLDALRRYFSEPTARDSREQPDKSVDSEAGATARGATTTSFAAVVFEQVVQTLAGGMAKAALEAFDRCTEPIGGRSLAAIAAELTALGNAVTVADLIAANVSLACAPGIALGLSAVPYRFAADDTFAGVLARFGIVDAAEVISHAANATRSGMLRPGVVLEGGYTTKSTDTFASIVASVSGEWTYVRLAAALQQCPDAISPRAVFVLPRIPYTTVPGDTLGSIAAAFGLALSSFAADIGPIENLFADPDGTLTATLPPLAALPLDRLLGQLRTHQAAANLAGRNARWLWHGVRPPSPTAASALGAPASLYNLTGQQIALPATPPERATLGHGEAAPPWLAFADGGSSVDFVLGPAVETAQAFVARAQDTGIPGEVTAIGPLPSFHDRPQHFGFACSASVETTGTLAYPIQPSASNAAATPRLWFAPEGFRSALAEPKRLPPAFVLEVADSSRTAPPVTPQRYGWATVVDITLVRRADAPGTYSVIGCDEAGAALLAALLDEARALFGIELLMRATAAAPAAADFARADLTHGRAYLVKTNLSPEIGSTIGIRDAAPAPATGVLNSPLDFARLLREASVTRDESFVLTYRQDDGTGLPDAIFADGKATLTVVALHAAVAPRSRAVNAVLIGDGLDPARGRVAAVAAPQSIEYIATGTESLADLTNAYRVLTTTLGEAAANAPLNPDVTLRVPNIVHVMRGAVGQPATETPAEVAARYGVTVVQIEALNPGVSLASPLGLTLLRIPEIARTGTQHATLAALADAYGVGVGDIAVANATVAGIFAAGAAFSLTDQWIDRMPSLPPGSIGFAVTRRPPEGTDNALALGNQFDRLGFSLADNVDFASTPEVLAVEATPEAAAPGTRAPWRYAQALMVAGSVKAARPGDLYAGIGSWAQIAFAWRDRFGNIAPWLPTADSPPRSGAQNHVPVRLAYTDALLGLEAWPGVSATYAFARPTEGSMPQLTLAFRHDLSRYAPDSAEAATKDSAGLASWQQRAFADAKLFSTLAWQLSAPGVTMQVTTTMDDGRDHPIDPAPFVAMAADMASYLSGLADGAQLAPPTLPALAIGVPASNSAALFPLEVSLAIARPTAQVDPAFIGTTAERATSRVAPRIAASDGNSSQSLAAFAASLEDAYVSASGFLKVATTDTEGSAHGTTALWIVRWRSAPPTSAIATPGLSLAIGGPARYYAPRPLGTIALTRAKVSTVRFDPKTGIDWQNPVEGAFTGVALDVWGQTALAALERFLSPDFARAAFLVDRTDPAGNRYLEKILALKAKLAAGIAATVEPILTAPALEANDPAPRIDAIETMRRHILARATNAYTVAALCQYQATGLATSRGDSTSTTSAPRLRGPIAARDSAAGGAAATPPPWSLTAARPELASGNSFVTTAMTVADLAAQTHLALALEFQVTQLERGVRTTATGADRALPRLSFVLPTRPAGSPIPPLVFRVGAEPADIPLPVRVLPAGPTMTEQTFLAPADAAASIAAAKRWTYAFTYQNEATTAQDDVDCRVGFKAETGEPPSLAPAATRALDLVDYLARVVSVWPAMERAMTATLVPATLERLDPASEALVCARRLVADFYQLLRHVPAAWAAWHESLAERNLPVASSDAKPAQIMAFSLREAAGEREFVVRQTLGTNTAVVWDPATHAWVPLSPPRMAIPDGGETWLSTAMPDRPGDFYFENNGAKLTAEQAKATHERQLRFDGLDLSIQRNAWAAAKVVRNRQLIAGNPTSSAFVYASAEMRFGSPLTPELERLADYDLASLVSSSSAPQPLAKYLGALMTLLFDSMAPETQQCIQLRASFAQSLAHGLPPSVLPVVLGLPMDVDAARAQQLAVELASAVTTWRESVQPQNGAFVFSLTIFVTPSGRPVPLLQIPNLHLDLRAVSR